MEYPIQAGSYTDTIYRVGIQGVEPHTKEPREGQSTVKLKSLSLPIATHASGMKRAKTTSNLVECCSKTDLSTSETGNSKDMMESLR